VRRSKQSKHAYVPAGSAHTHLLKYGFIVDILPDPKTEPPIYHCIIQKQGSREIMYWSQERSFRDAELNAEAFLSANRPDQARRH
jgi:hypothetical protein